MTTINATSWNGTAFVYNRARDTWEMSDNATIGKYHEAGQEQLEAATICADRENALFKSITVDEYESAA